MATRKCFLSSELGPGNAEQALFHVLPIPFEETTSYGKGTKDGPDAIIEASDQLELWDGYSVPAKEGIFTHSALRPKGNPEGIQHQISQEVAAVAHGGHIPIVLGGEHLISFGAIRAVKQEYALKGQEIAVVQIDAHADLRDSYAGSPWSHATVMKRIVDINVPIFQIGVRALSLEEVETRQKLAQLISFVDCPLAGELRPKDFKFPKKFPQHIYISFDVDGFDPSVIPATGSPVPGGLGWNQVRALVDYLAMTRTIVGFDVVELAPNLGGHGSAFAAAQLVYNTMGSISRNRV